MQSRNVIHTPPEQVEVPSGKHAGSENFPVGLLVSKPMRVCVKIFYDFARAIDDIADNNQLDADDKIKRLNRMEHALTGLSSLETDPACAKAHALRSQLRHWDITSQHGQNLIAAFRQDAVQNRYPDWPALIGYCLLSAAPVGRFLLDLHGEKQTLWNASDALCNALQIINHLQDCQNDFQELDRVYLTMDSFVAAKASVADLEKRVATPALRSIFDQHLDKVEILLQEAWSLPQLVTSHRLAMESAAILVIAERLTKKLRYQDPLARRVRLTSWESLFCLTKGIFFKRKKNTVQKTKKQN